MKIRERDRDISAKEKIVLTLKNKTKQKTGSYFSSKNIKDQQRIAIWGLHHGGPSESPCPASKGKRMLLQRGKGSGSGASQVALVVKNPPANARDVRDTGFIPGSGRSPGEGNSNPLQYSCLENPTDRG